MALYESGSEGGCDGSPRRCKGSRGRQRRECSSSATQAPRVGDCDGALIRVPRPLRPPRRARGGRATGARPATAEEVLGAAEHMRTITDAMPAEERARHVVLLGPDGPRGRGAGIEGGGVGGGGGGRRRPEDIEQAFGESLRSRTFYLDAGVGFDEQLGGAVERRVLPYLRDDVLARNACVKATVVLRVEMAHERGEVSDWYRASPTYQLVATRAESSSGAACRADNLLRSWTRAVDATFGGCKEHEERLQRRVWTRRGSGGHVWVDCRAARDRSWEQTKEQAEMEAASNGSVLVSSSTRPLMPE